MTTGHVSPDGLWRWDGQEWISNKQPPLPAGMQLGVWRAPWLRSTGEQDHPRSGAVTRVLLVASLTVFLVGAVSFAVNVYISVTAGRESDRLQARMLTDSSYNGDGYTDAWIRAADAEMWAWMGAVVTVLGAIAVVLVLTTRYGPKTK